MDTPQGALSLIDGAQAVPHMPVDVQEIGAPTTFLASGPDAGATGSGALWARRDCWRLCRRSLPVRHDPRGHCAARSGTRFPEVRAGTPTCAGEIGMGRRREYLMGLSLRSRPGPRAGAERATPMETLSGVPGSSCTAPIADLRGGVVSFNLTGIILTTWRRSSTDSGILRPSRSPLHHATSRALRSGRHGPRELQRLHGSREIDALAVGLREVTRIFDR